MIFAELEGKLGARNERAEERREDLLTSTAFGLLRYLPLDRGLGALLRRARVVSVAEDGIACEPVNDWLRLERPMRLEFWPRFAHGKEPDLRLTFDATSSADAEVVLIEVKLYSGKSSVSGDDDDLEIVDDPDETAPVFDSDQLVGYLQRQKAEMLSGGRASIVYLTAHRVPPRDELQASLRPGMRLAWLSWTDVWRVAQAAREEYLPAADLADLLRHKGLSEFCGFASGDAEVAFGTPAEGRFWTGATVARGSDGPFFRGVGEGDNFKWLDVRPFFFKAEVEGDR